MPVEAHDLETQILQLPEEDRARLLEKLIESFQPRSGTEPAWMELANRRREEVRSGKVVMAPGHEALARIRSRIYSSRTSSADHMETSACRSTTSMSSRTR
jgi:Putative addiction module component